MANVSKGALRFFKLRMGRLMKAVPTLDLRRKQLNRELMRWEERLSELTAKLETILEHMRQNPHPEVEEVIVVKEVKTEHLNIAGVMLPEVREVECSLQPYDLAMTPYSFDLFVEERRKQLELQARIEVMRQSLAILLDELKITTQRINLFEKRLIPNYQDQIRYIRGRLEDGERSNVMVAKIAQKELLGSQHTAEMA